jgi:hypothetical protein
MEEEIKKKLLEYLDKTGDFVLEQSPEVMQQALRYHHISATLTFFFCLFSIIILSSIAYNCFFYPTLDKYGCREVGSVLGCVIPLIFIWISCLGIFSSVDTLLKVLCSPKYFLLQLIMNGL